MRRDGVANRERILLAAEEVFGAHGSAGSTEEVARRAEVGVATVFRHFPTKQELIEATAVRHLEQLEAEARRLTGETGPGQAFASLMHTLVSTGATKLALANLLVTDGRGLTNPIMAASHSFQQAVEEVLERAQSAGTIRPDATVDDVFMLVRALAQVSAPDGQPALDRAVGIVLDGLRTPASTTR